MHQKTASWPVFSLIQSTTLYLDHTLHTSRRLVPVVPAQPSRVVSAKPLFGFLWPGPVGHLGYERVSSSSRPSSRETIKLSNEEHAIHSERAGLSSSFFFFLLIPPGLCSCRLQTESLMHASFSRRGVRARLQEARNLRLGPAIEVSGT